MLKRIIVFLMLAISIPLFADNTEKDFYKSVVRIANESVGMKTIPSVKGKHFTQDCIGYVRYVYYKAGLDLLKVSGNGGRGVRAIHNGLIKYGFVYTAKVSGIGDMIFFDNTYDVNKNGKWDDPLSHVGIIVNIGKHRTMTYIHRGSRGVKSEKINLYYPNTHAFRKKDKTRLKINSYLRRNRGEGFSKRSYIASYFYRAFAHIKVKGK